MIYVLNSAPITLSLRLDKTAAEVCELAKTKLHYGGPNEEFQLVEVKSSGGDKFFCYLRWNFFYKINLAYFKVYVGILKSDSRVR